MAEEHTVKTKLELDDHASHSLEHIKEGFEHVGEKAHEVQHEVMGFVKQALATATGFEIASMVETFHSIGEEVLHAAGDMEEQEKAIRGVLMMIDDEHSSLEDLTKQSHELNESFAAMSVESGASKTALVGAFTEMAERTGLASEEVEKLTGRMAQAGRAIPGGVDALSTGFANMAAGMIRARNPIVQLITATGVLKGNAKSVAGQLMKMAPDQAMKLGISAIEKMGVKMKSVPLSMNEVVGSLKELREQMFEAVGAPMLSAIRQPLSKLRDYFIEHREAFAKMAEEIGTKAGDWVMEAAAEIQEGFHYLEAHSAEIKQDIHEAMSLVRSTIAFIIDHRDLLAVAWGGSKVAGVASSVASMAGAGSKAGLAGGLVAEVAVLGYEIHDQWSKLMQELGSSMDNEARSAEALRAANAGETQEMEFMITELKNAGAATDEFVAHLRAIDALHNEWQRDIRSVDQGLYGGQMEMDKKDSDAQSSEIERLTQSSSKDENEYAAHFAAAHQEIFDTMAKTGPEFLKYGHKLAEQIALFNPAVAEALEVKLGVISKRAAREGAIKVDKIEQNFHGGVHINQDFKNTDPDRIATIFDRHFAKSMRNRLMATTQTPHTAF
jgi:hypothetical protein